MKPHTIAMTNEPITVLGERSESGHREGSECESEQNVRLSTGLRAGYGPPTALYTADPNPSPGRSIGY